MDQPLGWRTPARIFVNSMSDLFHEGVLDEVIDRVLTTVALSPRHTYQVLTKRPRRMRDYFLGDWAIRVYSAIDGNPAGATSAGWLAGGQPLPNLWLGVSVEDQCRADERIPLLLDTPAAVRWVSAEPLLGAVDLIRTMDRAGYDPVWSIRQCGLDWVVVGGESGPGARPMHPQWARSLRDQCAAAGVPFLHKQNGEWASVSEVEGPGQHFSFPDGATVRRVGKRAAGRSLDGVIHDAPPEIAR